MEPDNGMLCCRFCGERAAVGGSESAGAVPRHDLFAALAHAHYGGMRDVAPQAQSVSCKVCGAVTVTSHHATGCPFCGGGLVAAEPSDGYVPDAVAPFVIDEAVAVAQIGRWLRRRWFAPSDLHRAADHDRLQRVYLPYWSFSVRSRATYVGERGDASYHTETRVGSYGRLIQRRVRRVRWHARNGHVRGELRDFLVCASTSLPSPLIAGLAPWWKAELVPFSPEHLQGTLAERYRVDLGTGFSIAKQHIESELRESARRDIGGDEQRVQHLSTKYDDATFRQLLLPLWTTVFRYRGAIYRIAINGQTGRLQGSRPYSRPKIALALGAVAVAVAALWWALARSPVPPPPDPEPAVAIAAA
jgi:hypothetical protein